ncbi:hypothetical protein [Streptomyces sp. NPDC048650]|uniref:hypothetical protein n=1 Tax=Streptomyces sp. NPDC048650 TaxID=3365583 RepID=UPI00371F8094
MTASRAPLTRDGLRVKIIVQRVRLAGAEYRVIRPAGPLKNGALYQAGHPYDLLVDRTDGRRIGTLMLLAARFPRSLIHLPMRATAPEPWFGRGDEQPLDLVLVHRAVQLRPSRWKRLRERIAAGSAPRELRTARLPDTDLRDGSEGDGAAPAARFAPQGTDRLRRHLHAETLLLTGSTAAFRTAARQVFAVTKDGPPAAASSLYINGGCNYHVCRSLDDWRDLGPRDGEPFHVEYAPSWTR